jgi:transmembrane sensor
MTFQQYTQYTLTDFLEDDSFIQWVTAGDAKSSYFWQSFLDKHPEKRGVVKEAASIIRIYRLQEQFTNEGNREAVWQRINATLSHDRAKRQSFFAMPRYSKIAASIIFLIACGITLWLIRSKTQTTITTAYGEVKAVTLPDQSIVMLNGNSSLTYQSAWIDAAPREVWLTGEAYFDVQHLNKDTTHVSPGDQFIVHGGDLDINVLGTSFNVKTRRHKTNVALLSGKIEVSQANVKSGSKNLVLSPGDYVVYSGPELLTRKKLLKPHKIVTWTLHEITFTDPSLSEIIETLQDNYGYSIKVEDSSLNKLKIEGEISVTSVDELLSLVSATLGIRIETTGKKINITRK